MDKTLTHSDSKKCNISSCMLDYSEGNIAHVTWMFLRSFSGVEGPSRTYDSITGTHSVSLVGSNGAQNM